MPGSVIDVQIRRCVVRLSAIFKVAEVSALLDISESSVRRILYLFEKTGELEPLQTGVKRGRKCTFQEADQELLRNIMTNQNDTYLDEAQDIMFTRTGKRASVSTMSRTLARMGITNKWLTKEASERDPTSRADFSMRIGLAYEPHHLVFIDECYVDKRNTARNKGWAPAGERAIVAQPFVRGKRFTILPALSLDGILDCRVFEGSCNTKLFNQFLEGLLLEMQPFPASNSVLVLDNVSFHHNEAVADLADTRGVQIIYLPPYSPDFNPIEEAFSAVKAWVRRNNTMVRNAMESADPDEAITILRYAVTSAATPEKAIGWFRDSGYF